MKKLKKKKTQLNISKWFHCHLVLATGFHHLHGWIALCPFLNRIYHLTLASHCPPCVTPPPLSDPWPIKRWQWFKRRPDPMSSTASCCSRGGIESSFSKCSLLGGTKVDLRAPLLHPVSSVLPVTTHDPPPPTFFPPWGHLLFFSYTKSKTSDVARRGEQKQWKTLTWC